LHPTRYYSNKQEKETASKLSGGRKQVNSGATAFKKGDVTTKTVLVENKTTVKDVKSFSIKKEWLTKLKEEMFAMNKQFCVLVFGFTSAKAEYVVVPIDDYKELLDAYEELND